MVKYARLVKYIHCHNLFLIWRLKKKKNQTEVFPGNVHNNIFFSPPV